MFLSSIAYILMMHPYFKQTKVLGIETSDIEINHLLKAWAAISLAFAILLAGNDFFSFSFLPIFLFAGITVGIGFIAHEMSHKLVAQKYRMFAEFRANNMMLLLAIVFSFFGFIFAAPGAVMIASRTRRISISQNGKISAAGPLANIILAGLFLPLVFLGSSSGNPLIYSIGSYGFMINGYLGMFNLIPFAMFDGAKILKWNKVVYGIMAAVSVALVMLNSYLPKI